MPSPGLLVRKPSVLPIGDWAINILLGGNLDIEKVTFTIDKFLEDN
jgi:hypothetical protein